MVIFGDDSLIIEDDLLIISQTFYPSYVLFASIVYNMLSFMDEFRDVHISHVDKQYNCSTNLLAKNVLVIDDFFIFFLFELKIILIF